MGNRNAERRLRRAARRLDALDANEHYRTNADMNPPIRSNKSRFTRTVAIARRWVLPRGVYTVDGVNVCTLFGTWTHDDARTPKQVRMILDVGLSDHSHDMAIARQRLARRAYTRDVLFSAEPTIIRSRTVVKIKPLSKRERRSIGAHAVETWASKG